MGRKIKITNTEKNITFAKSDFDQCLRRGKEFIQKDLSKIQTEKE